MQRAAAEMYRIDTEGVIDQSIRGVVEGGKQSDFDRFDWDGRMSWRQIVRQQHSSQNHSACVFA